MAQQKFCEAEAEVEARNWEKRNSDIVFKEIDQEFECQRFQLHQASRWADHAQRDRISLCGELELRNGLFQENQAKDCQEIEEWRRICCEETYRARQARSDEVSVQQEESYDSESIVESDSGIREQSKFVVGCKRKQLWSDPRSRSCLYYSESQNHAALRFWIAA